MKHACRIDMQSLITMESLMGTLVVVKIQLTVRKQSLQFHTHVCQALSHQPELNLVCMMLHNVNTFIYGWKQTVFSLQYTEDNVAFPVLQYNKIIYQGL